MMAKQRRQVVAQEFNDQCSVVTLDVNNVPLFKAF